jgi:phage terminase large subunit
MKNTLNNLRVKEVFTEATEKVRQGKKPNISGIMKSKGYAPSSCKSLKVTQSKTWQELLSQIDNDILLNELNDLATAKDDKRAKLTAIDMLLKLKSAYPVQKLQTYNVTEERHQLFTNDKEE